MAIFVVNTSTFHSVTTTHSLINHLVGISVPQVTEFRYLSMIVTSSVIAWSLSFARRQTAALTLADWFQARGMYLGGCPLIRMSSFTKLPLARLSNLVLPLVSSLVLFLLPSSTVRTSSSGNYCPLSAPRPSQRCLVSLILPRSPSAKWEIGAHESHSL